jgi:ABC-type spermidine/putrescine transport system permease subunit I
MNQTYSSIIRSFGYAVGAVLFAGLLGLGSGVLMARLAPQNKFSWAGLAIAPLWLFLEVFFEGVVAFVGGYAKVVRIASTIAVVTSFYIAWFMSR